MSLEKEIMSQIKTAMKAKDTNALESLRAVKSAILLEKTKQAGKELTDADELKIVQKLVKQRKDSADIYMGQNRQDLADVELAQAEVIVQFLPKQMSKEEIAEAVNAIIAKVGASSMKDMGKVMGIASKELAGKADGKTISMLVKEKLA